MTHAACTSETSEKPCISNNSKTGKSCDFNTSCPKRDAGNPCPYCYVETARKNGFNAKAIYSTSYRGEIRKMGKKLIQQLNDCGGMRLFSFGDYREEFDADLRAMFDDADAVGLQIKAITKVPAFVEKFGERCSVVNVSLDNLGHGMPLEIATALRDSHANVRLRAVITSDADEAALAEVCDVLTFNHGNNGFHNYRKAEVAAKATKYDGKVCCSTGHCYTCPVRCGR